MAIKIISKVCKECHKKHSKKTPDVAKRCNKMQKRRMRAEQKKNNTVEKQNNPNQNSDQNQDPNQNQNQDQSAGEKKKKKEIQSQLEKNDMQDDDKSFGLQKSPVHWKIKPFRFNHVDYQDGKKKCPSTHPSTQLIPVINRRLIFDEDCQDEDSVYNMADEEDHTQQFTHLNRIVTTLMQNPQPNSKSAADKMMKIVQPKLKALSKFNQIDQLPNKQGLKYKQTRHRLYAPKNVSKKQIRYMHKLTSLKDNCSANEENKLLNPRKYHHKVHETESMKQCMQFHKKYMSAVKMKRGSLYRYHMQNQHQWWWAHTSNPHIKKLQFLMQYHPAAKQFVDSNTYNMIRLGVFPKSNKATTVRCRRLTPTHKMQNNKMSTHKLEFGMFQPTQWAMIQKAILKYLGQQRFDKIKTQKDFTMNMYDQIIQLRITERLQQANKLIYPGQSIVNKPPAREISTQQLQQMVKQIVILCNKYKQYQAEQLRKPLPQDIIKTKLAHFNIENHDDYIKMNQINPPHTKIKLHNMRKSNQFWKQQCRDICGKNLMYHNMSDIQITDEKLDQKFDMSYQNALLNETIHKQIKELQQKHPNNKLLRQHMTHAQKIKYIQKIYSNKCAAIKTKFIRKYRTQHFEIANSHEKLVQLNDQQYEQAIGRATQTLYRKKKKIQKKMQWDRQQLHERRMGVYQPQLYKAWAPDDCEQQPAKMEQQYPEPDYKSIDSKLSIDDQIHQLVNNVEQPTVVNCNIRQYQVNPIMPQGNTMKEMINIAIHTPEDTKFNIHISKQGEPSLPQNYVSQQQEPQSNDIFEFAYVPKKNAIQQRYDAITQRKIYVIGKQILRSLLADKLDVQLCFTFCTYAINHYELRQKHYNTTQYKMRQEFLLQFQSNNIRTFGGMLIQAQTHRLMLKYKQKIVSLLQQQRKCFQQYHAILNPVTSNIAQQLIQRCDAVKLEEVTPEKTLNIIEECHQITPQEIPQDMHEQTPFKQLQINEYTVKQIKPTWKHTALTLKDRLVEPPAALPHQRQYFLNQVEQFLKYKGLTMENFIQRDNVFDQTFSYGKTNKFHKLGNKDRKILHKFVSKQCVYPIKFRYINDQIGTGMDSSRFIKANEPISPFAGLVLPIEIGQRLKDTHNMMDYCEGKNGQQFVVTTCFNSWSVGPMFNHSKTPNMRLDSFITDRGLQYFLVAIRDILPGQHLTWDYGEHYEFSGECVDINTIIASIDSSYRFSSPQTPFSFKNHDLMFSVALKRKYTKQRLLQTSDICGEMERNNIAFKTWTSFQKQIKWGQTLMFYQVPGHFGLAINTTNTIITFDGLQNLWPQSIKPIVKSRLWEKQKDDYSCGYRVIYWAKLIAEYGLHNWLIEMERVINATL